MCPALPILCLLLGVAPAIETQFVQVAPAPEGGRWRATPGQTRAVVLIQGLYVHPFSKTNVMRAHLHSWQRPDGLLVNRLAAVADRPADDWGVRVSSGGSGRHDGSGGLLEAESGLDVGF